MIPLCEWGLQCGNDVVDAVKKLEQRAGQVVASGFRVMEPFRDQENFRELASVLLNESSKCNMSSMKALVKEILMRRWWLWVLCHQALTEEYIHPERSVFPVSPWPVSVLGIVHNGECKGQ